MGVSAQGQAHERGGHDESGEEGAGVPCPDGLIGETEQQDRDDESGVEEQEVGRGEFGSIAGIAQCCGHGQTVSEQRSDRRVGEDGADDEKRRGAGP